jgi:pyruvate dehydrogenase E2 component (dihydrolipoamide acetyltransferase)
MKTLTMPSFGSDMATGTLTQWHVKAGDTVSKGDIVATIETMKGLIDMEVFDDGVIESLSASEGQELNIGAPIAQLRLLNENDESTNIVEKPSSVTSEDPKTNINTVSQNKALPNEQEKNTKNQRVEADSKLSQQNEIRKRDKFLAISPAARKRAADLGVNWRQLSHGNGPEGAIILQDIDDAFNMAVESPTKSKPTPAEMMRQAIATNVSRSKREIPHYYLQLDVLLDKALDCLSVHNANLSPSKRILVNAMIYSAIARALEDFPAFNGFYIDGQYQPSETVHLGHAISLRTGGIMIAAIRDAQSLGVIELMDKLRDQVTRAREGGLRMSEVTQASVTISSIGDRGADSMQSIIFPPQVAIFGLGRPRKMPWIIQNAIVAATVVSISLAADHRVSDGHSGARLLNKINKLLQTPEKLL